METKFQMVAKTFQGLEDVLRDELIEIGAENVEMGVRMVTFEGDNEMLYKANICCRTALRILKPIVKFIAESPDDLYDKVRDLDWEQFMSVDSTFSIDSTVNGEEFTHSKFVTYRVKDGIADHFNDKYGKRPSIRLSGADLQLNVHISDNRVTISLDSSGEPLSKRGYRIDQKEAPINEVLAAGIIMKSGWRGDSDFIDPMCGSGTFLIEAALIAANINPGIYRESFAFEKWNDFDEELFEELYNDDSAERDFAYKIYGGDIDPEAVAIARKNVKNARVDDMVDLVCQSVTEWTDNAPEGILVTNPPYGERLKPENIDALYRNLGTTLKKYFQGWHAWIIGYRDEYFSEIGLKPSVKIPLMNGGLECSLREYVLFDGKYSEFKADGGDLGKEEKRKDHSQGPKKVRHISDDDWDREAKKFNSGKSFVTDKKKAKPFNRDTKKQNVDDFGGKDFSRDNDNDFQDIPKKNYDNRAGFNRDNRNDNRGGFNRDNRNDNRGGFNRDNRNDNRGGFNRDNRNDNRGGFNRDNRNDNRGGFNRDNRNDNRGGFNRDNRNDNRGGFNRDNRNDNRGGRPGFKKDFKSGVNYDPSKSKGPRLSEDSETVINPVHMRSRKNRQ